MRQGQFEVIDSFAIQRTSKFYLLGTLKEGKVKEGWFVNIPLNDSLSIKFKILGVENVTIVSERKDYEVLIISASEETLNILLGLNIGMEYLDITIGGDDE